MKHTVHFIGNAHLDPVWLWRYPDGFSEIKATFRSALDRMEQFDEFIFTCGAISYYKWVKDNCPEMFAEIQEAVKKGKWCVVGAQWVQPDCNIPSLESHARHYLISQRFVRENLGTSVRTGYNVDSFGHNRSLPKLLRQGGMENYVYMRPCADREKVYPFAGDTFVWECRGEDVLTFHIPVAYTANITDPAVIGKIDEAASQDGDTMFFYGVGNHGGGPTVRNVQTILAGREDAENAMILSSPDAYFDARREAGLDDLPHYEGDLQNHASGCYSANSDMKMANRTAECRLVEAEKLLALSRAVAGDKGEFDLTTAWQQLLFNQFHDILCGCSIRAAYDDALAADAAAKHIAVAAANHAAQSISWAIDTDRGVRALSHDRGGNMWEMENLGTPVVVFNPLSYPVKVPVDVRRRSPLASVTDSEGHPVAFQEIAADYAAGGGLFEIIADLPAYGWNTYWFYTEKTAERDPQKLLRVTDSSLENDRIAVAFDRETGNLASITDKATGRKLLGGVKTLALDDSHCDTWSHAVFVFDRVIAAFGEPSFRVLEDGECRVTLEVTQRFRHSRITKKYSLLPGETQLHVDVATFLDDARIMVKETFLPVSPIGAVQYESPADYVTKKPNGREEPMQRYFAVQWTGGGCAVATNGRHSASATDGAFAFVAARSCYFADHNGASNDRLECQDLGERFFKYVVIPFEGAFRDALPEIDRAASVNQTVFPAICETYHKGALPTSASFADLPEGTSLSAVKAAEDGDGLIVRICETAERTCTGTAAVLGHTVPLDLKPMEPASWHIREDGSVTRCNFVEDDI